MRDEGTTDVTLGEVWRGQLAVSQRVDRIAGDVADIKATLAGQTVRMGVMWGGLGVAAGAVITTGVTILGGGQ